MPVVTAAKLGSESGPLENNANNWSAEADRRATRWLALAALWRFSRLDRVRKCGRVLRGSHVEYRRIGDVVGLAGLVSCGSVWSCPRCNAKVMARRRFELGCVLAAADAQGYTAVEITLTLRHALGDELARLWSALSGCWERARSGREWHRHADEFGIAGWLRVVEVTDGRNGWHPHVHGVVFVRQIDAEGLRAFGEGMFGRWQRAAIRQGLEAPEMVGQEWHVIGAGGDSKIAEYLTDAKTFGAAATAMGLELTSTQSKRARSAYSTRSTWEVLEDAINGETRGLARWWEFEQASSGKRQISYSQGLRELLGVDFDELRDEQISAEELGSSEDAGLIVTPSGWHRMASNPDWIPASLEVLRVGGWSLLARFLEERAIEHRRL